MPTLNQECQWPRGCANKAEVSFKREDGKIIYLCEGHVLERGRIKERIRLRTIRMEADLKPPATLRIDDIEPKVLFYDLEALIKGNPVMPDNERQQILAVMAQIRKAEERYERAELAYVAVRVSGSLEAARNKHLWLRSLERTELEKLLTLKRPSSKMQEEYLEVYNLAYRLTIDMRGTPLLYAQRIGDRKQLARHVRHGGRISQEMRQYIADLIEGGSLPRAPNRHKSADNAMRNRAIVWFILRARASGVDPDASTLQAVDKFGIGKRYIQKIFSQEGAGEPELLAATDLLLAKLRAFAAELERTN